MRLDETIYSQYKHKTNKTMKTFSIAISLENEINIISYQSEKKDFKREMILVIRFVNMQICNIKSVEKIHNHKLKIVSDKDTIYDVSWKTAILWDESELD